MSRQEILLGVLPTGVGGDTPRTANVKINAMTAELYARDAALGTAANRNTTVDGDVRPFNQNVLKYGDWGLTGHPVDMASTASFNDCTRTGNYIFGNSGLNGPGANIEGMTYCYVIVVGSADASFCAQEAVALNGEKRATRFLWGGVWSPWRQILQAGDFGLGGNVVLYTKNIDDRTQRGFYYVNNTAPGARPPGYTFGILETFGYSGDSVNQIWTGITGGTAAVSKPTWTRCVYGDGNWSPWRLVYDQSTAVGIVGFSAAAGGRVPAGALMESGEIIDGNGSVHQWHKFATGLMLYCVQYNAGTTAAVPITVALYSAFVGNASCTPNQIPSYAWTTLRGYAAGSSCVIYPDQTLAQSFMVSMIGMWG